MTLALDLGNSALKAASFDGDEAITTARFPTSEAGWQQAFSDWISELQGVEIVGLSSVVPAMTPAVSAILGEAGLPTPIVVSAALPLPLAVSYATPATLGADRLAAIVAAWGRYGPDQPVVAVDAGTAITYEVVSAAGVYAGGAIAPGPHLLATSLNRGTAQLPAVPLEVPPSPVGESTITALQSGIMFGFLDGVAGMLRRIERAVGGDAFVVATGGWAEWIAQHVHAIDAVRPLLVLEGVRDIVRHARAAGAR